MFNLKIEHDASELIRYAQCNGGVDNALDHMASERDELKQLVDMTLEMMRDAVGFEVDDATLARLTREYARYVKNVNIIEYNIITLKQANEKGGF